VLSHPGMEVAAMTRPGWTRIASVTDTVSAEIQRRRLTAEGVAVEVRSDSSLLGEARRCDIFVPSGAAWRAQAILDEDPASEAELAQLAGLHAPPGDGEGRKA
jgi:hypothetical protein